MKYLLLLTLIGCSSPKEPTKIQISDYITDKKYCIANCMKQEFKNFHSTGKSWGTGSSSMNGLSQVGIYDRVKEECVNFYKDEKCCAHDHFTAPRHVSFVDILKNSDLHGTEFGVCATD